MHTPPGALRARKWIFATGALTGLGIVLAALVILSPLTAARNDLRHVANDDIPVQGQLGALRTTLLNWQVFFERHIDNIAPGTTPTPSQLASGALLAQTQQDQETTLANGLRGIARSSDARDVDAAMKTLGAALEKMTPIAVGSLVPAATRARLVENERTALERLWNLTTALDEHLAADLTAVHAEAADDHLGRGRTTLLIGIGLDLLLVLGTAFIFGRRAGRQERVQRLDVQRRAYEARLLRALEMTKTEPVVYDVIGASLHDSVRDLSVEMLIADSSRAHFRRALTNNGEFDGCGVVSPLDCPAATGGQALMFPSSGALDACPHLKDRPSGPCSAACLPVSIAGRAVGVTYAVGRDGIPPSETDLEALNFTSRRGCDRIAMLRAFATSETQARTDPLTGLLNRRSLEHRVRDLRREGTPYSLAYGDLDHFKILNDTYGHDAGDRALRLFARVLRDSIRPNDIAARYGGEEFVIVLPDCGTDVAVVVLERVRERLTLALTAGHVPSFTVTFGVASTAYATEYDEIVAIADRALLDAKSAGRNRVVAADFPGADREPIEQI
jgi:diguanylate cyclase (GGDEF)-like protein